MLLTEMLISHSCVFSSSENRTCEMLLYFALATSALVLCSVRVGEGSVLHGGALADALL